MCKTNLFITQNHWGKKLSCRLRSFCQKEKKTTLYHENAFISQYNDISFGFVCEEKKTYKVNLVAITESIWLNSRDDKKWGLQAETSQAILRSKTRDYCFMLKIIGYWPIILPSVDMRRRILIFHWFFFLYEILMYSLCFKNYLIVSSCEPCEIIISSR